MIQEQLPEAVLSSLIPSGPRQGNLRSISVPRRGGPTPSSWAGLGQRSMPDTAEAVLSDAYVPIVMDADAVNLAADIRI
ncbi:MAG: hypothetical protein ACLU8D_09010 [Enterocloster sp.]